MFIYLFLFFCDILLTDPTKLVVFTVVGTHITEAVVILYSVHQLIHPIGVEACGPRLPGWAVGGEGSVGSFANSLS